MVRRARRRLRGCLWCDRVAEGEQETEMGSTSEVKEKHQRILRKGMFRSNLLVEGNSCNSSLAKSKNQLEMNNGAGAMCSL